MIIKQAWAEDVAPAVVPNAVPNAATMPAPDPVAVLLWNIGFIAVLVLMFYWLLIRPQQLRMREHTKMLNDLKRGQKIVLQSGMIATIEVMNEGAKEIVVTFVDGHKAEILRSAIAGTYDQIVK